MMDLSVVKCKSFIIIIIIVYELSVLLVSIVINVFLCDFFFRECNRMLQKRNWEKDSHKVHFESGVRMGIGAFNLVSDVAAVFEKREVLDLVFFFFFSLHVFPPPMHTEYFH